MVVSSWVFTLWWFLLGCSPYGGFFLGVHLMVVSSWVFTLWWFLLGCSLYGGFFLGVHLMVVSSWVFTLWWFLLGCSPYGGFFLGVHLMVAFWVFFLGACLSGGEFLMGFYWEVSSAVEPFVTLFLPANSRIPFHHNSLSKPPPSYSPTKKKPSKPLQSPTPPSKTFTHPPTT